jgi:hypothetical protein
LRSHPTFDVILREAALESLGVVVLPLNLIGPKFAIISSLASVTSVAEKERVLISARTKVAAAQARGVILDGRRLTAARKDAIASIKAVAGPHEWDIRKPVST